MVLKMRWRKIQTSWKTNKKLCKHSKSWKVSLSTWKIICKKPAYMQFFYSKLVRTFVVWKGFCVFVCFLVSGWIARRNHKLMPIVWLLPQPIFVPPNVVYWIEIQLALLTYHIMAFLLTAFFPMAYPAYVPAVLGIPVRYGKNPLLLIMP